MLACSCVCEKSISIVSRSSSSAILVSSLDATMEADPNLVKKAEQGRLAEPRACNHSESHPHKNRANISGYAAWNG